MDNRIVPGAYYINKESGEGFPSGAYAWGVLLVFAAYSQQLTVAQIYLTNNGMIYFRTKYWGEGWGGWRKITGTDL